MFESPIDDGVKPFAISRAYRLCAEIFLMEIFNNTFVGLGIELGNKDLLDPISHTVPRSFVQSDIGI